MLIGDHSVCQICNYSVFSRNPSFNQYYQKICFGHQKSHFALSFKIFFLLPVEKRHMGVNMPNFMSLWSLSPEIYVFERAIRNVSTPCHTCVSLCSIVSCADMWYFSGSPVVSSEKKHEIMCPPLKFQVTRWRHLWFIDIVMN